MLYNMKSVCMGWATHYLFIRMGFFPSWNFNTLNGPRTFGLGGPINYLYNIKNNNVYNSKKKKKILGPLPPPG